MFRSAQRRPDGRQSLQQAVGDATCVDCRAALSDNDTANRRRQETGGTDMLSDDEQFMRRALALAARGRGRAEPNPLVGAVVVKDGCVRGEGFHQRFGEAHAEINAIRAAGTACKDGTLYVTLEPCTGRHKKTPPCCDAVIKAGLGRVVIGARDPTQEPAVPRLEAAGIAVTCAVLEPQCRRMIAPFLKLQTEGKPYVIAKWAMTADGKIATVTGDARWISAADSRKLVHQWRGEVDAVLVGIGTVKADNPLLTCRIPEGRNPKRVVLDSNAALSPDSKLVRSTHEAPLLVACLESAPEAACRRLTEAGCRVLRLRGRNERVDVDELLARLGEMRVTNLLVEGGAEVFSGLFEHQMVDEVRIFVAPKLAGGTGRTPVAGAGIRLMGDAIQLEYFEWQRVGPDILLIGTVPRG